MKHAVIVILVLIFSSFCFGQQDIHEQEIDSVSTDTISLYKKYREDQFYVAVTYNLLANKPDGVSQSGFSSGFHFGFIRDMPINKRRNVAIGVGLGISTNSYNQNLLITEATDGYNYEVINGEDDVSFSKNKFSTYSIELPIEFRWRTSTYKEYKFWRIYSGVKFGYIFANRSKFKGSLGDFNVSSISDIEDFQYGLTLGAGYGTWNFHFYYALNPIFTSNAKIDNTKIDASVVRIGLILYIL